jgi:DNA-binding GntR family transcriptional regulator
VGFNPDDSRPPYRQIADDLRQAIAARTYEPGEKLPATRELVDRYGVANQTVQSAIRVLRDEGLVETRRGTGTFVVEGLDPSTVSVEGHSLEYLTLRRQVDQLAGEVANLREQLLDLLDRLPLDGAADSPSR